MRAGSRTAGARSPRAAKQKLMELPDAGVRLQLVDEFLRSKGLLS
ncbi:MAG: hypothetical protein V4844_05975 [Pseudomonadota bacterium]